MSISWVGCQSKMDVPFNRFLCLQTSKRDTLSAFLWGVPFPRLKMQKTIKKGTHSIAHIYIERERKKIMSISWVGCQSKMDVPFHRFLCLQTHKRKHLGSSLEDAGNGPTRTPVPSPIYGERERGRKEKIMSISWVCLHVHCYSFCFF